MKWDGNKRTVLISRMAACLFLWAVGGLLVWSVGEHRFYAFQNRALTTENKELSGRLADKNQSIDEKNRSIDEKTAEIEELQKQLVDDLLVEEYVAGNGFYKKTGFYLIDTEEQLFQLRKMLREGEEIEKGLPAAGASYRLRNDIDVGDERWFCLGTEENPFYGVFDGDGHTIEGRFSLMDSITPEALFHMDGRATIENLHLNNIQYAGEIRAGVSESRDCEELESHLPGLSNCSAQVEIGEWGLDVERVAKVLRRHWEQGNRQDGFYVSMNYHPDLFEEDEKPADAEKDIPAMQEALCTLAGEEYAGLIREAMEKEEGYLWFVRLEQVGELTCCTFEISEPEFSPDTYGNYNEDAEDFAYENMGYYVALEGRWEGKKIQRQCFRIPYTYNEMHSIGISNIYKIEAADLDFDGKNDLLLHEGFSSGSGGSRDNYRALRWKENAGQFDSFPSFPENVFLIQLNRQRMVNRYNIGAPEQHIVIYEVVDGEYVRAKELIYEWIYEGEGDGTELLSYYEMGELVETHVLSDYHEREILYPDMNYWME